MKNYHKYFENKHGEIDKKLFNKVITEFNKGIVDLILNENISYKMPALHLELQVRKEKRKPRLEKGKLVNPVPVDWKRTNALWERDEEAKKKKLLVRYNNSHSSGYVFRIMIKKFNSSVKNKSLLKIKPNRAFQRKLSKRIKDLDNPFDAYLYFKIV